MKTQDTFQKVKEKKNLRHRKVNSFEIEKVKG